MKRQGNNSKALRWIYNNSKKHIPAVIGCALISAVTSVAYVVIAYVSSFVIDIAIGKKQGDIAFYITVLFLLIAFQAALNVGGSMLSAKASGRLEKDFRRNVFVGIMKKEYSSISKHHSGDILNRFTSDVDVIVMAVVGVIPGAVSFVARLLAALIVLISISKSLGVAVIIIGAIVASAIRVYAKYIKKIHKQVQESQGNTRSYMQECTENMVVVKTFNSAGSFGQRLGELMQKTYVLKLKRNLLSNVSQSTRYLVFTGGYYAALSVGAFLISGGTLTYGSLIALLNIIQNIRRPLTQMSGLLPQYYQALASAERIMEIEELPDEKELLDKPKTLEIYKNLQCIKFSDVGFSYDGTRDILQGVNMQINKGELVALVGGSGEGKSTIFRMLLGLYRQTKGNISAISGEELPIDSTLRGLFAYVPQGNLILSGTIAENIRFCNLEESDSEVIEAAKTSDLYDFIKELPEGFNTVVGERGLGLSEGQLQRISIARALLCGAPILLLDECTSALDEATERKVLSNIKAKGNITAILISHRPAALEICDKVYAIEHGVANQVYI